MQRIGSRQKKTNEQLIEEILLEQYDQYYRLAYSYVKNEADAGDIVQNGAYKSLRSSHTLRQQEYAKTWVYRIMLNEIFAHLRKPQNDSYEYLQEVRGYEAESVEDEEIAEILNENVNTVKSRLYRSMKKLKLVMIE